MTPETDRTIAARNGAIDLPPPEPMFVDRGEAGPIAWAVPPHLRDDLVIREVDVGDAHLVVVKDLVTHVLVRLGRVEWSLAKRFDGSTSLERARHDVEIEDHVKLDAADVLDFVARFRSLGFLDDVCPIFGAIGG